MIQAKELRPLNLIWYNDPGKAGRRILCVDAVKKSNASIQEKHDYNGDLWFPLLSCDPIPLDEKWLERCGFIEDSVSHWKCSHSDIARIDKEYVQVIFPMDEDNNMKLEVFLDPDTNGIRRISVKDFNYSQMRGLAGSPLDIKFVHQLQNIFFTFTGQELEIKQEA